MKTQSTCSGRHAVFLPAVLFLAVQTATSAFAQNTTWIGAGAGGAGTSWSAAGNWSSGIPANGGNVIYNISSNALGNTIQGDPVLNNFSSNVATGFGSHLYANGGNNTLTINGTLTKTGDGFLTLKSVDASKQLNVVINTIDQTAAAAAAAYLYLGSSGTAQINDVSIQTANVTGDKQNLVIQPKPTSNITIRTVNLAAGAILWLAQSADGTLGTYAVNVGSLNGTGGVVRAGTTGSNSPVVSLNLTGTSTGSYSGIIQNGAGSGATLSVVKSGAATQTLKGVNTYTGATTINEGTLALDGSGSINSTSGVSVLNGAVFTNQSTVVYNKALTLAEGSVLDGTGVTGREFAPTALTLTADLSDGFTTFALGTTGLTKAGNLEITLTGITAGNYTLFTGSDIGGTFSSMTITGTSLSALGAGNFGDTVGGYAYQFSNANNLLTVSAIPEPATYALLTGSLAAMLGFLRRRGKK